MRGSTVTAILSRMTRPERSLGPGLITGAADADPSNVAAYSQVGAQLGYQLAWAIPYSYPLLVAVQQISARMGRVTGCGLAANLVRSFPPIVVYPLIALLLVANVINLAADLAMMGAATSLVLPGPAAAYAVVLAAASAALEIFVKYERYARILRWVVLVLFAYVGAALMAGVDWVHALRASLAPTHPLGREHFVALTAILGTTISPYLFFWQSAQEVEVERERPGERPLKRDPRGARRQFRRIAFDTRLGMAVSQASAYFILLTATAVFHAHGVHTIDSATQAAQALRPIAGAGAELLFCVGILGSGLLAVPALAGASAYALSEALHWPTGLGKAPARARGFYSILALTVLLAAGLNVFIAKPVQALYVSAVINGAVAAPLLACMMWLGSSRKVMGALVLPRGLRYAGWVATLVTAVAALAAIAG